MLKFGLLTDLESDLFDKEMVLLYDFAAIVDCLYEGG
jgi:hypothetical protein